MIDVLHFATIAAQRDDWHHTWVVIAVASLLGVAVAFVLGYVLQGYYEEFVVAAIGFCCVLAVFSVGMQMWSSSRHADNVATALEHNIAENFTVEHATLQDGIGEFMRDDDETPAVLTFQLEHSEARPTTHRMVYDEYYDIVVPLQDEAAAVTPYIASGSTLDTVLQEHSAGQDDDS